MKRPSFQFYPKEWIWDLALRQCSIAARGLWADLLCLMHEGTPYGHLADERGALPLEFVLRLVGLPLDEYSRLLAELAERGVFSRTEDRVIFSRRMVRDEERRAQLAENGKRGGRPVKAGGAIKQAPPTPATEEVVSIARWDEFKRLYPAHRFDEQMACQIFISRAEDEAILAGLRRAIASDDWRKDDGKFVPWASKFIAEGKYSGFKASAPEKPTAYFDPKSITGERQ
jgi:hypothetical protein